MTVADCSVELWVVGELERRVEGLALVDVRLNVTTANLRCSANMQVSMNINE